MLVDQLAQEVVHSGVRDFHGHRRYVANGAQDRKVEVFARVDLDDVHVPDLAVLVSREELRLLLDRGDGRAQPDSHEISPGLLAERLFEIAVDVVRERLEGRDVEAIDAVLELATELLGVQLVDDGQESGERLAAPRRGRDEDALPRVDEGYGVSLGLREALELRPKPVADQGLHEAEDLLFGCGGTNLM